MTEDEPGNLNLGLEILKGFWGKIIQAGLGFAGTVLFSRALGPTDFGGYYLLLSVVMVANRPIMGISVATKKRFAEHDAAREQIVGTQLAFNLAALALVTISAVAFRGQLADYTGLENAALLFVVLFGSILAFAPTQQLISARGKISAPVWIDTLRSLFTFPLQLALVLFGLGATGMAFGLSGATLLVVPISLYYLRTLPAIPNWETVRSIWEFARFSIWSRIIGRAYDELDPLLLGYLLAPAAVGYYQVAYKLTIPGMFIATIASSGLLTKVSNLDARGESFGEDVTNAAAMTSILAIPMFFGALAIPERLIITFFEVEYVEAAPLLVGLTLFTIVRTQSSLLGDVLNGLDRPLLVFRGSFAALVVNVVVGIPLTLQMGAIGVVIATVFAEFLRYLLFFVVLRNEIGTGLLPRPLLAQAAAGAVMFGIIEWLHGTYVTIDSWVMMGMVLAIAGVVYFSVLAAISRFVRTTVRSILLDAIDGIAG